MDTDSLVYHIKTKNFYADIADNVPARFDTSGYCPNRPLPVGLNKKVIGLMKDELGGAIMTEFMALRPKLYSYKKLDGSEDNKCKGIKKCVVKKTLTCLDWPSMRFIPLRLIRLLYTEMMIRGFLGMTGFPHLREVTKI